MLKIRNILKREKASKRSYYIWEKDMNMLFDTSYISYHSKEENFNISSTKIMFVANIQCDVAVIIYVAQKKIISQ